MQTTRPISLSRSKLIIARLPSVHLRTHSASVAGHSLPLTRHGLLASVLCIQWTAYLKLDVAYGLTAGGMDYANSKGNIQS